MAKDKTTAKKETAAKPVEKKGANKKDDAALAAKKEARKEALKNRPAGQRPNSKQIDVIATGKNSVVVYGASVRKTGTLVTTIVLDEKCNAISAASTFVPGVKVKVKKEHGALQPGVAGEGKKKKGEDADSEEDED